MQENRTEAAVILELRMRLGCTQQALATQCSLALATVTRYECGVQIPRLSILTRFAHLAEQNHFHDLAETINQIFQDRLTERKICYRSNGIERLMAKENLRHARVLANINSRCEAELTKVAGTHE